MRSLLYGNGLNIQFGKDRFCNASIVRRVLGCYEDPDFPLEATCFRNVNEILWLMGAMFKIVPDMLAGGFDSTVWATFDSEELQSFKERYGARSPSMFDIGIEDYLFLMEALLRKVQIDRKDAYTIRRCFERVLTYAIYDHGRVNEVYKLFPDSLSSYFSRFDVLFTTNYDLNVDVFTGRDVRHLHGRFDVLEDVYNPGSMRNHMSDAPLRDSYFDVRHEYLFSNVIYSYSGFLKEFTMTMAPRANEAIKKLTEAFESDEGTRREVLSWLESDNTLTAKFAESISLSVENPNLKFDEYYPVKELGAITGTLEILGLSPSNDRHLFDVIANNEGIDDVVFYYHTENEAERVEGLFGDHRVFLERASDLWEAYR